MEFGERIRKRREELGLTQEEVARLAGYSGKTAISRIERGESDVPRGKVSVFADVLQTSPSYLMGWTDNKEPRPKNLYKISGVVTPSALKKIPMLGVVACGKPIWAEENYEYCFIIDSREIQADFCLKAKGDSMIDEGIYDGDIAFFRKTPVVDNGEIAAVLIGCEATLKRFYKTDRGIILQPANDKYSPMIIDSCDAEDIVVLGKLVAHLHSHK